MKKKKSEKIISTLKKVKPNKYVMALSTSIEKTKNKETKDLKKAIQNFDFDIFKKISTDHSKTARKDFATFCDFLTMLNEKSNKNVKVEEFLKSLNLKEEVRDMKKKLDNSNVDFSSV